MLARIARMAMGTAVLLGLFSLAGCSMQSPTEAQIPDQVCIMIGGQVYCN
jgi:hypothetical protein